MKATGITRQLDPLGRIVLPMELRRNLNLNSGDSMEIYTEGNSVVIKKYNKSCEFCGCNEQQQLSEFKDTYICCECIEKIKKL